MRDCSTDLIIREPTFRKAANFTADDMILAKLRK